ncbi:MAG TPA: metal ABC transporter permease [Firmicutes bacterium]|nr:metal ABC transporter permease [Bacillota bacterium]
MESIREYFSSPFVIRGLAATILIAINAGVAGSFAAFRNSTFLIAGASHAALAGAAAIILFHSIGVMTGVDPMIGGGISAILLTLLAAYAGYSGKTGDVDTAIGVGFAFSMAVAVLIISLIPESAARVWAILLGDLLLVTYSDLRLMSLATVIVVAAFMLFSSEFLFITFDIGGAKAFGIRAERYNLLMFGLIGLSVAVMLKGIGAILVFAVMVAPPAASMLFARSVGRVIAGAVLIALSSGILGIFVSYFINISVSALTAFFAASAYFIGLVILFVQKKRFGSV